MTETIIRCDHCRKVLAPDYSVPQFRLRLECASVPPTGPTLAMVMVRPPIPRPLDFCGLRCLAAYLNEDPNGS